MFKTLTSIEFFIQHGTFVTDDDDTVRFLANIYFKLDVRFYSKSPYPDHKGRKCG